MGGTDTKGRYAIHWGPPETYGERREESALRRAGRTVPDPAYEHFHGIDLGAVDEILDEVDHDPKEMLRILAAIQAEYGYVPVAALKRVSQATGAWYAMLYGTATYYDHLAVGAPESGSGDRRRGLPGRARWRAHAAAGRGRDDRAAQDPVELAEGAPAGGRRRRPDRSRRATRAGAFDALTRAVRSMTPGQVVTEVAGSGLRGRGGSGFPTGVKWRAAASAAGGRKYVVANGYGADPAVQTDRTLLEAAPYAVLEGMALAAYAIGAHEGFIAVRADAAETIRRLEAAIAAAEEAGFIGPDVIETGWPLTIEVRPVQGAYMLGEETVLLKALEGKRGQPEQRPPHPAERGLFGQPTLVNNVQTLAAVPWIVGHGAEAYAAIGSKASPGTILVQLRGPGGAGIAEVPIGTPLRTLVGLVDGGKRRGGEPERPVKAVLVGGPSGGFLPPDLLDTPYEYEALRAVDAHVGSGSIVVADDRACIVDLARLLTRFCADQACGKTIPCRIGTRRLSEVVDRIAVGTPKPTDAELAVDLASDIVGSALCDHERLATLPTSSAMRYFRAELDEHLLRSTCPAGVCHPIAVAAVGGA